jgi:citrate synthase
MPSARRLVRTTHTFRASLVNRPQGRQAVLAVAHYLSNGLSLAGLGHHLYPDGDPRAAALLALFEPPKVISCFIAKVKKLTGLQPNIDVALAAMLRIMGSQQMRPSALSRRHAVSACWRTVWSN